MSVETDLSCVVVSIRGHRESLVLETAEGTVTIELTPMTAVRTRAVIRAPRSVQIRRQKHAEPPETIGGGR